VPPIPPLRALLIGDEWVSAQAGGLNRYLADLVDGLASAGVASRVVVVGRSPGGGAVTGVSEREAPLVTRLVAARRAAARMAPWADVVDAHFALYAVLPILTTPLRRLPLVVHFQGPWADEGRVGRGEGRPVGAVKRAIERAVYRRAEIVVVLSQAFGRLLVDRYGVDPGRVEVVAPGVDLDRFRPGDRMSARSRFGLAPAVFVAVSVRRLDARMGLDVLLDAWAKVHAERPDAVLLVAGAGRERAALERRRARLPHPDGVCFLGAVSDDDLVALYRAADCSVVPTLAFEGFGLVTLESAACGTPAIVTDVGGLPDGVAALDATLILPAGDVGALAYRLLAAAGGDLPDRATTRAHAEGFSWDGVARRHLELYDRARTRRPLRVAFLGHTAQLSGAELALTRLLPALTDVEPNVLLAEDGPLVAQLGESGIPVEVLPMGEPARSIGRDRIRPGRVPVRVLAGSAVAIWRLSRRLRADRPDIVHTNTLKAALYGGAAGRLAGVPVVWHLRDRIASDYLPVPAVRMVRAAARVLPTAVIGNSESTLATLGPRIVGTRIYDGVAVGSAPSGAGDPRPTPGEHPFTVGLVGRLAPWKGQDLFLRAFARSFPDGDARARVVGSAMFGEEEWARGLRELAASLGVRERVDFVGFRHDVAAEYARCDVFVHASLVPEPFGQVVFEAMAAGVAVVAPDAGGPAEIITDGCDGLLYRMGDVDALAAGIRRLAEDGALRASIGSAGRLRVADLTPERTASQVMEVYADVLARRPRRRVH